MSVSCVEIDMPWREMNKQNAATGKNKLRAKKWQANETADKIGVDVVVFSFTAEAFTDAPAARATKIPRPRPPPAKASAAAPAAPGDPQAGLTATGVSPRGSARLTATGVSPRGSQRALVVSFGTRTLGQCQPQI